MAGLSDVRGNTPMIEGGLIPRRASAPPPQPVGLAGVRGNTPMIEGGLIPRRRTSTTTPQERAIARMDEGTLAPRGERGARPERAPPGYDPAAAKAVEAMRSLTPTWNDENSKWSWTIGDPSLGDTEASDEAADLLRALGREPAWLGDDSDMLAHNGGLVAQAIQSGFRPRDLAYAMSKSDYTPTEIPEQFMKDGRLNLPSGVGEPTGLQHYAGGGGNGSAPFNMADSFGNALVNLARQENPGDAGADLGGQDAGSFPSFSAAWGAMKDGISESQVDSLPIGMGMPGAVGGFARGLINSIKYGTPFGWGYPALDAEGYHAGIGPWRGGDRDNAPGQYGGPRIGVGGQEQ